MSDDAFDFNTGRGLASGGGSPDWNSQSQVDGWNAQKNYEATYAELNPPRQSPSYEPPTWNSPSRSNYSTSLSSSGSYSNEGGWQPLIGLVLGAVGSFGAYTGYTLAHQHHWSETWVWLSSGGGALGAVLACVAAFALVAAAVMAVFYVLRGIAIATWWLTVKAFWVTRIVGGLSVAGWAITVASCRWLGVCRFFFAL